MFRHISPLSSLLALLSTSSVLANDNGLALTPQMGWDNWNALGCSVSEDLLIQTAELIVNYNLRDLGYHYVILDDCWSIGRNGSTNGTLIPNPKTFPKGMKHVSDHLHELDLGFGMYSDAGKFTCGGYTGSAGYEELDAQTFASWGVDYLKYDNCFNEGQAGNQLISYTRYAKMGKALNATGRPILYSICNWGEDYPWNWASTIANSWRITGDIKDSFNEPDARCPCDGDDAWNCGLPGFHCSVTNILNKASFITSKSQPGAWNDLDMLEVGNDAMTDAEYVAHFSMWAAVKSPLIMGNDIREIRPADLAILSNPAVIAISQDPKGSSASRRWIIPSTHSTIPSIQLWSGSLFSTTGGDENDMVVLLVNGLNTSTTLNASLADIFSDNGLAGTAKQVKKAWEVRDLWGARMPDSQAAAIIKYGNAVSAGNETQALFNATCNGVPQYNATKTSYAEGLKKTDPVLLGTVTTTIAPAGTLSAVVDSHGARMFRLRVVTKVKRTVDEL